MAPIWSAGWGPVLAMLSLNYCLIYQGKEGHTHTMHTLSCKKQIKASDRGVGTKGQEDKEVVFVSVFACACGVCVCLCFERLTLYNCWLAICHQAKNSLFECVYIERKDETGKKERNSEWGADVSQHSGWNMRFNSRLLYERRWRGRTEKKRGWTSAIFTYCSVVWVFLHNILTLNSLGKWPAH